MADRSDATTARRGVVHALRRVGCAALVATLLAACVSGGGIQPPSGTGASGGNGNVPTYH